MSRQICIVSSSGTYANREETSKEHIISLPCLYVLAKSTKSKSLKSANKVRSKIVIVRVN